MTDSGKRRVFSGIQPTGQAHLGNYLGAVRHWVASQDDVDGLFCIVDLHSLTESWDADDLRAQTLAKAAELLACGIDPARSVLFVQSHVAEHAELAWVLTCIARMGELRRMVQFKERSRGETEAVGVGVFSYPVLMAADILLYQTHEVPVGDDQRQHVELTRDLAGRFNSAFGPTFELPRAVIPTAGARIMALDDPTQKMSKSQDRPNSNILILDEPAAIEKKIKAAVTDSGREVRAGADKPALTNLLTIYSILEGSSVAQLEERYSPAGYGQFKADLANVVVAALAPLRERYQTLESDRGELERVLAAGAGEATRRAQTTMAKVRARSGLLPLG